MNDEELGQKMLKKYPQYQDMVADSKWGDLPKNIIPSAGRAVSDFGNVIAHPVQTVKGLGALGLGLAEKVIPGRQKHEAVAEGVGEFYKQRYGGAKNIKETLITDPVGSALDLSTILSLGGGAVSKVGKVGKVAKAADVGSDVSKLAKITKIADAGADASRIAKIGTKVQQIGTAMDPFELAMKAGGAQVAKIPAKIKASPFAKQFLPDVAKLATEKGVDLPISSQTTSEIIKTGEAITSKGLFGRKIVQKVDDAKKALGDMATEITERYTKDIDVKDVGKIVKKGFDEYEDAFRVKKTELYDAVPDEISKVPALYDNTLTALDEVIASKKGALVKTTVSFYEGLKKRIEGVRGITYDNLKKTRTEIGKKLKSFDPMATGDKASMAKVYASLSDDLDQTIRSFDPGIASQIDEANAFFREGINKINSKLGKSLTRVDPEKIVDVLVKPNSETTITRFKELIGEDGIARVQEAWVSKIMNQAKRGDVIDLGKLKTLMGRYGDSTIKALLTDAQYENFTRLITELEDLDKLQKAILGGRKIAEGSQTGFINRRSVEMLGLAIKPSAAIKAILGEFALSKIFTTNFGKKLLTTGVDIPLGKVKGLLNQIVKITKSGGKVGRLNPLLKQLNMITKQENKETR